MNEWHHGHPSAPPTAGAGLVHVVDDEAGVREALSFLLGLHGFQVNSYPQGEAFLDIHEGSPAGPSGVVLLDVRMEPLSGLQVHERMRQRQWRAPVLFLSGHGDIPMAVEALQNGAFDFIEKPCGDDALIQKLHRAMAVARQTAQQAQAGAELAARVASLTDREREVIRRVASGMMNKVIADDLGVAMRTVEVHRARALAKLGVRSAAEAAALLVQLGPEAWPAEREG
ncbi:MAG: response regulator transcription factor [Burkholderiaceae bacterium]|nr:MAG: response regulator transcription factor [Burkholderiaceae bacterium]